MDRIYLRLLLILVLVMGGWRQTPAQSRRPFYSREISLASDNDYLSIEDYYYTAGQDFFYRRLLQPNSKFHRFMRPKGAGDSVKVIVEYHYGFKIFTPLDIDETDVRLLDRPYAGWNFGRITFSNFPSSRSGNQYQLEMGIVGPASGMESLQRWIHQLTHYTLPKGWMFQVPNEWVANLYYARLYNWRLTSDIDFVSESSVQAGTGSNKISQEITMRLIQFNDIGNSVFNNSRLNWDNRSKGRTREYEFFFLFGAGVQYVLSNIFIEGSLISGNKTQVNTQLQPWVITRKYGLMFSKHDISWSVLFHHLSKEMKVGESHDYASLSLAVRF